MGCRSSAIGNTFARLLKAQIGIDNCIEQNVLVVSPRYPRARLVLESTKDHRIHFVVQLLHQVSLFYLDTDNSQEAFCNVVVHGHGNLAPDDTAFAISSDCHRYEHIRDVEGREAGSNEKSNVF